MEFLEDTGGSCSVSSGRTRVDRDRGVEEVPGFEGEEGGRTHPRLYFSVFFPLFSFLSHFCLSFFWWFQGSRR